jgi:hypothetical protein
MKGGKKAPTMGKVKTPFANVMPQRGGKKR